MSAAPPVPQQASFATLFIPPAAALTPPAGFTADALGAVSGAPSVSTGYSAEPDASAPDGALGSVSSLALVSSGTDSLRIWSSEATAAHRPQLVLTFGVE